MIYLTLFYEFFMIGLFAVGGGLSTIPFLFDLSQKYNWFSTQSLTEMIAVSEATPGPIGINMATYAGFNTAGVFGAISATFGLVLPSLIIIISIAKISENPKCRLFLNTVLKIMMPVVLGLVLNATIEIGKSSVNSLISWFVLVAFLILIHCYKKNPVFYIFLSGILGFLLNI